MYGPMYMDLDYYPPYTDSLSDILKLKSITTYNFFMAIQVLLKNVR